jgi:hypothetical protein
VDEECKSVGVEYTFENFDEFQFPVGISSSCMTGADLLLKDSAYQRYRAESLGIFGKVLNDKSKKFSWEDHESTIGKRRLGIHSEENRPPQQCQQ